MEENTTNGTAGYVHLGEDAVDDILRNIGVTITTPAPRPVASSASVDAIASSDTYTAATSSVSDLDFLDDEDEDEEEEEMPQTTPAVDNNPRIIENRYLYDSVFASRFFGAPWAEEISKQKVMICGQGGIGRF